MTANFDNSAASIPGVIRDAATGVSMIVNSDGSLNITAAGTKSFSTASTVTLLDWIPGTIRDPVSGTPMVVNADGSINVVTS